LDRSFVSIDEIESWLGGIERKLAKEYAYRLLTGRSYAKAVLSAKLAEKKFSRAVCDEIVGELEKLGYLRDEEYLANAIERELLRGYGSRYIEKKLRAKGIKAAVSIDRKRERAALEKAASKMRGKERRQAVAALLRRGFDFDLVIEKFPLQD
jgi:SOS response regulatory protein OraA/RecX